MFRLFLLLIAVVLVLSAPAKASGAQPSRDIRGILDKLQDIKDVLDRAKDLNDYVSGVVDDVQRKKEPRKLKVDKFKRIDERLQQQLRDVRALRLPQAVDAKAAEFDTTAEVKKGDAASQRKAADKLIAFNKALRERLKGMESVEKSLNDLANRAQVVGKAGSRLATQLGQLQDNAVVRAAFQDAFGMAFLELEGRILPAISDIRSAAQDKAREFKEEIEKSRKVVASHSAAVRAILETWRLPVPHELRD